MPENGFPRIKTWSDLGAIVAILVILVGALIWGIRLDMRSIDHEARISKLEAQ